MENTLEERRQKALNLISSDGGFDGGHHKQWVLDQVVRILTGCPEEEKQVTGADGKVYTYTKRGENDEYKAWVAAHCAGEDGPYTYSWDPGIPP